MISNYVSLLTIQDTPILISYNIASGIDIKIKLMGSGGVIKADSIKIKTTQNKNNNRQFEDYTTTQ